VHKPGVFLMQGFDPLATFKRFRRGDVVALNRAMIRWSDCAENGFAEGGKGFPRTSRR